MEQKRGDVYRTKGDLLYEVVYRCDGNKNDLEW